MAYFCHKEGPCWNSKFPNEHSEFQNVGMRVTEEPFDGGCKAMRHEKLTYWVAILSLMAGPGLTGTDAMAQSALPGPSIQPSAPAETKLAAMPANPVSVVSIPNGPQDESYKLGSGDKLKLTVYGENDLGGECLVDGAGQVQLPLLGQIPAAGLSVHDFETAVGRKFVSERYLKDPKVSVEVENYRPFYIIGEVKSPGQYPYVNGMNALNAVALAGGYTYRADDKDVYIRKDGGAKEQEVPADQTTKISPGDIIRIDERIF
jgi:protein involved in polysaccharide export with SLBB domain